MTILQTLVTKKEPLKGEKTKKIESTTGDKFDRNIGTVAKHGLQEMSDEERKHRNFLGLKLKAPLKLEELDRLYKQDCLITPMINWQK